MMRKLYLLLVILMAPLPALAATFSATVDDNHVTAGNGIALQLTLSGAQPKGDPDTTALAQSFNILGQAETSETSIVNGNMSSSIGWQLTLLPKQNGRLVVPSIGIDTDNGRLNTKPITLEVSGMTKQPSSQVGGGDIDNRNVTITASANTSDPYQNQPILYTVKVVAHASISDISIGDVTANNAIVQAQGKPEATDALDNGVPVKVVEFHYILTPIMAERMTIAPVTMQGTIQTSIGPDRSPDVGDGFMDPLAMLRNMGAFLRSSQTQPFSITSNEVTLNVKPPTVAMDPWLPLKDLQIKERIDLSQPVKVGDPITRKFTMLADGMGGGQLPSLEPQQAGSGFKVYADKAVTTETIDKGTGDLLGTREESYSLIPTTAGESLFPAIKVPWWDVKNSKVAYAEVPARTIEVAPGIQPENTASSDSQNQPSSVARPSLPLPKSEQTVQSNQTSSHWQVLFVLALVAVLTITLFVVYQMRKVTNLNSVDMVNNENKKSGSPKIRPRIPTNINWDEIHTAKDLNASLIAFAHDRWGTPKNAALESIISGHLKDSFNAGEMAEIRTIGRDLTAAIYGGKNVNLEDLTARCRIIVAAVNDNRDKIEKRSPERLPVLNPS